MEERIDREPLVACTLLALLIVGPPAADPVIRTVLDSLPDEGRWIAIESMLVIDPVRLGEVLVGEHAHHEWASGRALRALRFPVGELELRLAIACAASPNVVEALITSKPFTQLRFFALLAKIKPRLLREALAGRVAAAPPSIQAAIQRAILAMDRSASKGAAGE